MDRKLLKQTPTNLSEAPHPEIAYKPPSQLPKPRRFQDHIAWHIEIWGQLSTLQQRQVILSVELIKTVPHKLGQDRYSLFLY